MNQFGRKSTAEWLRSKYEEEKNLNTRDGIKGIQLTHYSAISEKLNGIQPGMHGILSKANIGKTTVLTSMCVDMLRTATMYSEPVKTVFYTFDDDDDDMRIMMIAYMADVNKKKVERYNPNKKEADRVEQAYEELITYAKKDWFAMKHIGDIPSITELLEDIEYEKEIWDQSGFCGRFCVFLDGQSNLSSDITSIREANIDKANKLMSITKKLKIPIILTLEVPKLKGQWRPCKEDVMESVKYAFNCKSMIALSPIDDTTEKQEDKNGGYVFPVIVFEFVKNKFGGFKGYLFGHRIGSRACFRMASQDEHNGYMAKAAEFNIQVMTGKRG